MGPEPSSLYEDARRLLSRFGADIECAERPENGASNEVWLADQVVLRVSRSPDGSLEREAALAAILPLEVGYPAVLGCGTDGGVEWMVTERLPGINLERAWRDLDSSARIDAVHDLWSRLHAAHRTDVDAARRIGCTSTPFYALEKKNARNLLDSLTEQQVVDPALRRRLRDILDQMFGELSRVPVVLTHTDAGPNNTVWTATQAVPIDFEFACVAPADLELENLFRTLSWQPGWDASPYLRDRVGELLTKPGAHARLRGYAVLRDLWALRLWLRKAQLDSEVNGRGVDADDLQTWAPLLHLRAHADRTSWLAKIC